MDGLTPERVRSAARDGSEPRRNTGGAAGAHTSDRTHSATLIWRTVQREVIPRLIDAHCLPPARGLALDRSRRPQTPDLEGFVAALTASELADAWTIIEAERARGQSLESIYLEMLLPAADLLAARWEDDRCGYDEIALGMLHLQQLLQALAPEFIEEGGACPCGRRALLLSSPGEARMLGTYLVTEFHRCLAAEFFQQRGWEVWRTQPATRAQLFSVLRTQWFDVIDITASCPDRLAGLAREVTEYRNASRNARVRVLASGPVFAAHPELAARIGADAAARDPRDLLAQATAAVEMETS